MRYGFLCGMPMQAMNLARWGLVLSLAAPSCAAELPEAVLPSGAGVNIHFTRGHEKDLDLIAAAGFRFIRMDFGWAGVERKKGQYDWSDYDQLTADLDRRGLRAYYILDYSNPLYEENVASKNPLTGKDEPQGTGSPQHPESIAAFARWVGAAAGHFRGRHVIWEIWNEPNIFFWKPKPDVAQYTALALAAAKAVRAADPQATLVAPATSAFPWDFLERFLQSGILEYLDAVSVHPYRSNDKPPETAAQDYERLRDLIRRYAPGDNKRKIRILSGEWGYSSHNRGVSPEIQAAYLTRQQLSNLLNDVPLSIWYDWKNDGEDPAENEHNFGTVTHDLRPKPASLAMQPLARHLAGCRIVRRLPMNSDRDYVLLLAGAAGQKLAGWTQGERHEAAVDAGLAPAGSADGVNGYGEAFSPGVRDGKLWIELDSLPNYAS